MNRIICFVCGKRITKAQMESRQWWHEPECNHGHYGFDSCDCDLESHFECIPLPGTVLVDDDDDVRWTDKYLVTA